MSDLTRRACESGVHASILHNTCSNACADENTDKIIVAAPRSMEIFAERRDLNIIANCDGYSEMLLEDIAERHIAHTQVWCIDDDARLSLNLSRCTNANGEQGLTIRQLCGLQGSGGKFDGALCNEILPALSACAFARGGNDCAGGNVDNGGERLCSAQVDTECVYFLFVHLLLALLFEWQTQPWLNIQLQAMLFTST